MKRIHILFVCLLFVLISGCLYPATYFKPKTTSISDYEQGAILYVHRQDLNLQVCAYKLSKVFIVNLSPVTTEVMPNLEAWPGLGYKVALTNMDVAKITLVNKADGEVYELINSGFEGGGMKLQFDPNAWNAEELILNLPLQRYHIDKIGFKKTKEIRVISING